MDLIDSTSCQCVEMQVVIASILQAPRLRGAGLIELLVVALVVVAVLYFGYKAAKESPNKMWVGGTLGGGAGALCGFLLRPSAPFVGQLAFGTVVTRGANLRGLDELLVPVAQASFNYMLVGAIVGVALGIITTRSWSKK